MKKNNKYFSKFTHEELVRISTKQYEEIKQIKEVSKARDKYIEKLERKIEQFDIEKKQWFEVNENAENYANATQFEHLELNIKILKELNESKDEKIKELKEHKDKLIEYAKTNKLNIDKAKKVRLEKKEERKKVYIQKIKELKRESSSIMVSDIIKELVIQEKS